MASDCSSPHSYSLRLGLPTPKPSRRHHAQSLLGPSFHAMIPERIMFSNPTPSKPRLSPAATTINDTLLKLSLLSLRPSLLQFVSIVSLLLNDGNSIFELVCVFSPFLFCLYFSDRNELQLQVPVCNLVVITTAIPLLLLP